MSKTPLVPRHNCLGLGNNPNKETKSHSFYTGEGVKPMPFVMFGPDPNYEKESLEPKEEIDHEKFLKTFIKNINKY